MPKVLLIKIKKFRMGQANREFTWSPSSSSSSSSPCLIGRKRSFLIPKKKSEYDSLVTKPALEMGIIVKVSLSVRWAQKKSVWLWRQISVLIFYLFCWTIVDKNLRRKKARKRIRVLIFELFQVCKYKQHKKEQISGRRQWTPKLPMEIVFLPL